MLLLTQRDKALKPKPIHGQARLACEAKVKKRRFELESRSRNSMQCGVSIIEVVCFDI